MGLFDKKAKSNEPDLLTDGSQAPRPNKGIMGRLNPISKLQENRMQRQEEERRRLEEERRRGGPDVKVNVGDL